MDNKGRTMISRKEKETPEEDQGSSVLAKVFYWVDVMLMMALAAACLVGSVGLVILAVNWVKGM